jgi:hypothetical protein
LGVQSVHKDEEEALSELEKVWPRWPNIPNSRYQTNRSHHTSRTFSVNLDREEDVYHQS